MLQFNNNHIFTGYLKQFLSSFNLPTCRIYTAEFERYKDEHGQEDPRVIESIAPIRIPDPDPTDDIDDSSMRPAVDVPYLKDGSVQQYFLDTCKYQTTADVNANSTIKYWKSTKELHYNGNKIFGLTKTLKNPTTLYNYQTHEYLGDYLRFLRDYENINLLSMYNCFSNRVCNNIKYNLQWNVKHSDPETGELLEKTVSVKINAYDTNYKIYMLPVKLFENYTIAIDCYQGIELFCGFYNEKLNADKASKEEDLIKRTYLKVPKTLFSQPFVYDKLDIKNWNFENDVVDIGDTTKILRSEVALREGELKLFIKVPASNKSSVVVLAGDYRNFNDSLYTFESTKGWQYQANSTAANFETKNCINCKACKDYETCSSKTEKICKKYSLPDLNSREFKPISKLQLLALNTGISYPFADRLIEYLVANVILPNDVTPDNIKRLQKVMEDCGYSFQIDGVWEPKMQMILYDYLMNSGKFTISTVPARDKNGNQIYNKTGMPVYKDITRNALLDKPNQAGNLKQIGQGKRSEFYDILGYVDKDAEKLYASWEVKTNEKTGKKQVVAKNTLENVDIYSNLYNN